MKPEDIIEKFHCEPKDEYDKALIFSLKKWISDEINEMCDNGICALAFSLEGLCGYIGYNTKKQIEEYGDGIGKWKSFRFASVNDDAAADGSVEMWYDFKEFDKKEQGAYAAEYFRCALNALLSLVSDGIIKERFGRNIEAWFVGYEPEKIVKLTIDENGEMTY